MIEETSEGKTNYCVACAQVREFNQTFSSHTCGIQDNQIMPLMPQDISISKWCVKCYPKRESAEFTFRGDSLCEKCFKKTALI